MSFDCISIYISLIGLLLCGRT